MKLATKLGVVTLSVIVPIAGMFNPTMAQAKTTYHRAKIVKVSAKPYYSLNKKAKTYAFKGSAKRLVFKYNHALKNYTKTTWIRTKKSYVTKHGKKYLYYYVTNSKNNAKGWVWHKYLKSGKNYQSSKVTSYKGTYQRKKIGKFYTITGNKSYIKFGHGVKLTTSTEYSATKKRTIYKHDKSYKYYYVTNKTTHQNGWVWSGYVKKTTKVKKATPTKVTVTPTTKPTIPAKPEKVTATPTGKLNITQVASQAVNILNSERSKEGFVSLTADPVLTRIANERAQQLLTEFDHNYKGQVADTVLAKKYGIYDTYFMTEDLTVISGYSTDAAGDLIYSFQSDAHWNDITNPSASTIGIGLAEDPKNPGTYYVAVEMGF